MLRLYHGWTSPDILTSSHPSILNQLALQRQPFGQLDTCRAPVSALDFALAFRHPALTHVGFDQVGFFRFVPDPAFQLNDVVILFHVHHQPSTRPLSARNIAASPVYLTRTVEAVSLGAILFFIASVAQQKIPSPYRPKPIDAIHQTGSNSAITALRYIYHPADGYAAMWTDKLPTWAGISLQLIPIPTAAKTSFYDFY
jgi:hypothetical protein